MRLTEKEIESIRPISNNVLIKCDRIRNDEVELKGGIKLYIGGHYQPVCYVSVWGEIVNNPKALYYNRQHPDNSMQWKTEIETKVGDRVMFNYTAAYTALGVLVDTANEESNPKWFMCGDDVYIFLNYQDLILVKNGEEITMLNGFLLTIPLEEEALDKIRKTLILPEYLKSRKSLKYTTVWKIGSRNQEYLNEAYAPDTKEIQEGDMVLYDPHYNIEPEFTTHQQLGRMYFRIQRKNISAIIKQQK